MFANLQPLTVRFGYITEDVLCYQPRGDSEESDGKNPWQVEHLGVQVRSVSQGDDKEWLQNCGVMGESNNIGYIFLSTIWYYFNFLQYEEIAVSKDSEICVFK